MMAGDDTFRVLVCGGREYLRGGLIRQRMMMYRSIHGARLEVIHGNARGADKTADTVCRALGIRVRSFPADWKGHGKAAGPIRNKVMLAEKPDVVEAFKDGFDYMLSRGGTENMVRIALDADVPVYVMNNGVTDRVVPDGAGCLIDRALLPVSNEDRPPSGE